MKKNTLKISVVSGLLALSLNSLLFTQLSYAHGGHDHGTSDVQGTQGGLLREAHEFYLEVVGTRSEIKFYPQVLEANSGSKKLKNISLDQVKLSATYQLPKEKKAKSIALTTHNDHFLGSVDVKEAHRYQVDVQVQYGKVKEHFTYQVEP